MTDLTGRQQRIIDLITSEGRRTISQTKELLQESISQPTLNRDLAKLTIKNLTIR